MSDPNITRVTIEFAKVTPNCTHYRVRREDGSILIEATGDPEHDACRALLAEGIKGRLVTRWNGAAHDSMAVGIEWGACRTTSETAARAPRTVTWSSFDPGQRPTASAKPPMAHSRGSRSAPAARNDDALLSPPARKSAAGARRETRQ